MARPFLRYPPRSDEPGWDAWARTVTDILSRLPEIVTFHTASGPNVEGIAANPGTLGIELNEAALEKLWYKDSDSTSTSGWRSITVNP